MNLHFVRVILLPSHPDHTPELIAFALAGFYLFASIACLLHLLRITRWK